VKWPESHEFVLTKKIWHEKWRDEVTFTSDEDPAKTQQEIEKFLANPETGSSVDHHLTWDECKATAMTGIPSGESMEPPPTPEPAVTAVTVKSEHERAVHPDFCGAKYDETHSLTVKNIAKLIQQWPGKANAHKVIVAKATRHPMCKNSDPLHAINGLLDQCSDDYKDVENRTQRSKSMEEATYPKRTWKQSKTNAKRFGGTTRPSRNT